MGTIQLIKSDFKKCNTSSKSNICTFFVHYFKDRGFKYVFWLRLCKSSFFLFSFFAKIMHRLLSTIYGIQIPSSVKIGSGFRINHGTGLIINETAIIGNDVCFHQFTTVGTWKGQAAIIGNNVMIGPGCNIVDNVKIGNNVVIGAGAVVVKDVPDNCVIAGNPAKILRNL